MNRLLNCPLEIYVGIEDDTWKGNPLAYVTYKKPTGEIAKEWSFTGWCSDAEKKTFKNESTEGFKVLSIEGGTGGRRYDNRKTWFRILDPRGFQFEIGSENFMEILTRHVIDKGLIEGSFAYGWDGSILKLVDTNSSDWQNGITSTVSMESSEKVTAKTIKVGHSYCLRDHNLGYYIGRLNWHSYNEKNTKYGDRVRKHELVVTPMHSFVVKFYNKYVIVGYKEIKHVKFDTGKILDQNIIDMCIKEFNNNVVGKPLKTIDFLLRKRCNDTWRCKEDVNIDNASYEEWIKMPVRHPNEKYDAINFKIVGENRLDVVRSFKFPNGIVKNYMFESFSLDNDCIIDDWYIESHGSDSHFQYESYIKHMINQWNGDVSQLTPTYNESTDMFNVCTKVDDKLERVPQNLSKTYELISVKNKNIKF